MLYNVSCPESDGSRCVLYHNDITNNVSLHTPAPPRQRVSDMMEHKVAMVIITYVLPVVIFGGTIGNILSFAVMVRKKMRNTSVYFYLAILACWDTCVLYLSGFKTWIRVITNFELLHISNFGCKSIMFLFMVSLHMCAWLVVAMTTDRFVVVWLPLKAPIICAVRRARMITAAMFILMCAYKLYLFWTIHLIESPSGRKHCAAYKTDYFMNKVYPILKLASYSIIPFSLVLILNLLITFKLCHNRAAMRKASESPTHNKVAQHRMTVMLLVVSFTWLILSAPWTLRSLLEGKANTQEERAQLFLSKTVCFLLMYMNHSINFILYCLTGNKFRSELKELLCSLCCKVEQLGYSSVRTTKTAVKRTNSPWENSDNKAASL